MKFSNKPLRTNINIEGYLLLSSSAVINGRSIPWAKLYALTLCIVFSSTDYILGICEIFLDFLSSFYFPLSIFYFLLVDFISKSDEDLYIPLPPSEG